VELELAFFSNFDSTPTDLMTSKRTTKKTTYTTSGMGNSNSGAGVNSGVDAFLPGVGVELELVLPTLELELEWLTPGVAQLWSRNSSDSVGWLRYRIDASRYSNR
jgi:hypothetical protein